MKALTFIILSIIISASAAVSQNFVLTPERKLQYAEGIISKFYVDSVDRDTIVDEAIRAMLKTLDPHSAYSTPEETRELNEPLNGNFSGVGIQFNMGTDTLYVIQTVAGGPSEKVGLLPGDRIIMVNDTVIAGVKMKNTDVMKRLRGPKGSVVNVKIKRHGVPELIEFNITRDDIPIYSVDAAYMADPTTGYIRISRFAEQTPQEFTEAMTKLRKQGMKQLIIDLQDNGGGYLNAAQELAGHFLKKGDLIVYTDSPRAPGYTFVADKDGDFRDGRVVVLVNQFSASASEILAGAIQDHDRGVIVGRRTFGKGLVQRPFPFPDGSMIRLTVSKYFTPSGRCIQKPYVKGDLDDYIDDMKHRFDAGEFMHSDSIHFPDSLQYKTLHAGRTVYGGGGIMPDRFIPLDTAWYTTYYRDLLAKGTLYQYVLGYVDQHRESLKKAYPDEDAFARNFEPDDEFMQGLIEKAEKDGTKYDESQFRQSESYLRTVLKALLARDLYEDGAYYKIANGLNPTYTEGLKLINDIKEYNKLLDR